MQTSASGGTSDTEVNALAVRPCNSPEVRNDVITVTPVAKWPITRRSSFFSIGIPDLSARGCYQTSADHQRDAPRDSIPSGSIACDHILAAEVNVVEIERGHRPIVLVDAYADRRRDENRMVAGDVTIDHAGLQSHHGELQPRHRQGGRQLVLEHVEVVVAARTRRIEVVFERAA